MNPHADACEVAQSNPLLVLVGDVFNGPRVEGAACSGWAATATVVDRLGIAKVGA